MTTINLIETQTEYTDIFSISENERHTYLREVANSLKMDPESFYGFEYAT